MEKSVPIFYFSGTGNTWWVANRLAEALSNWGFHAQAFSIEQTSSDMVKFLVKASSVVALGYPIYGSDAPEIMKDFIDALPTVQEPKSMLIYVTQMEWSGNGAYYMRRKIEAKGYKIKWAVHFRMPNNISVDVFPLPATSDYTKFTKRLNNAERMAEKLAACVKDDKRWIHSNNPAAWLGAWLQRGPFRYMLKWAQGRTFTVNTNKCIQCGRCETICPVDNVRLNVAGFPEWGDECNLCMRCFNYCPSEAINVYGRPFNHQRFGEKPFQGPVPEFKPELIIKKK